MNRTLVLIGSAILTAATVSACAERSHTDRSMLSGTHSMLGSKSGTMVDRAMPSRSADCTEAALATMPPDHRRACEGILGKSHESQMLSGSHAMSGAKPGVMSDKAMPAMSSDCSEAALAKMPPAHREACGKAQPSTGNQ